jgi:hypothetical protein
MSQPYFNPAARQAQKLSRVAVAVAVVALVAVIALLAYLLIEGLGGSKGEYVVAALPLQLLGWRSTR